MKRGENMNSIKQLMCAGLICFVGAVACVVHAADTVVTNQWNVTPWNVKGPTLETFESLPVWATNGQAGAQIQVPGTARGYYRFWTNEVPVGQAMSFATPGITNAFSGAKIQSGMPLFIDMRCKLNPFDTTPPSMESNTLLCFYANEKSNLVVASASQCITNSATVDPTLYYPIMIRFSSDTFDVFFNNSTNAISLNATTNEISKMVISGAGEMDDLYVSYGDPMRTSTNSLAKLSDGSLTPSAEELVIVNWLANKGVTGNYAIADAANFYLTDTAPTNTTFTGELGIGSFNYNPSTSNVTVVVTLKTDASAKKTGKINGLLGLKGAGDYTSAKANGWVDIGTKAMLTNDFVNGVATYKFELTGDANTNKFFLPVIKSNIQ
jgi:hypothetical protein